MRRLAIVFILIAALSPIPRFAPRWQNMISRAYRMLTKRLILLLPQSN